jgi:hypothetical protein
VGQSCGELKAHTASYRHDHVRQTIILYGGVIDDSKVYVLSQLKAPVALFIGRKDIAYKSVCQLPIRDNINLN